MYLDLKENDKMKSFNSKTNKTERIWTHRILIIGPYPGKVGGVSIFVKRLHESSMPGIIKYVLNTQNFSIPSKRIYSLLHSFWLIPIVDLVHINTSNLTVSLLFCLVSRILNKKVITQFHSARFEIKGIKRVELKIILKLSNGVVAVNKEIEKKFIEAFPSYYKKISVIPPFIMPASETPGLLPAEILNLRKKVRRLIIADAFKITPYNGNDLYGLELSIDMFNELVCKIPDVGFIFVVATPSKTLLDILKNKVLHKNFMVYERPVDFLELLKAADIFVRPTYSDGDSLSIREALSMGVPTIASNAVKRPEYVLLFDINKPGDYLNKIIDILKNFDIYKKFFALKAKAQNDFSDRYKALYYKILGIYI